MIKSKCILLFVFIFCFDAFAQNEEKSLAIQIQFNFDAIPLELNKKYLSKNNDTLSFETIRLYLIHFEIQYDDKSIFKEKSSYHLIDIHNPESLKIKILANESKKIQSIKFNVGVDSLASVSGAMKGDLDATNGMYWAWQSGFINMKMEGISSSCKTRKNKFQFHIGGYLEPNYAMRTIEIPIENLKSPSSDTKYELNLIMNLEKLFSEISLKETNTIMIPGKEAMKIADLTSKIFSIE